jgi:hypothetical protein
LPILEALVKMIEARKPKKTLPASIFLARGKA